MADKVEETRTHYFMLWLMDRCLDIPYHDGDPYLCNVQGEIFDKYCRNDAGKYCRYYTGNRKAYKV